MNHVIETKEKGQRYYLLAGEKFTPDELLELKKEKEKLEQKILDLKEIRMKLLIELMDRKEQIKVIDSSLDMWKDFYRHMKKELRPIIIEWNKRRNKV